MLNYFAFFTLDCFSDLNAKQLVTLWHTTGSEQLIFQLVNSDTARAFKQVCLI